LLRGAEIKTAEISPEARLGEPTLQKVYEYDMETIAGQRYRVQVR
jgi:hypothetical protein